MLDLKPATVAGLSMCCILSVLASIIADESTVTTCVHLAISPAIQYKSNRKLMRYYNLLSKNQALHKLNYSYYFVTNRKRSYE